MYEIDKRYTMIYVQLTLLKFHHVTVNTLCYSMIVFCIYPCNCYVQFRGEIKLSVSVLNTTTWR